MPVEWLFASALIGALTSFSVWAYISRRRLEVRTRELERSLDHHATELESARLPLLRLSAEDSLTAVANHEPGDLVARYHRDEFAVAGPPELVVNRR